MNTAFVAKLARLTYDAVYLLHVFASEVGQTGDFEVDFRDGFMGERAWNE